MNNRTPLKITSINRQELYKSFKSILKKQGIASIHTVNERLHRSGSYLAGIIKTAPLFRVKYVIYEVVTVLNLNSVRIISALNRKFNMKIPGTYNDLKQMVLRNITSKITLMTAFKNLINLKYGSVEDLSDKISKDLNKSVYIPALFDYCNDRKLPRLLELLSPYLSLSKSDQNMIIKRMRAINHHNHIEHARYYESKKQAKRPHMTITDLARAVHDRHSYTDYISAVIKAHPNGKNINRSNLARRIQNLSHRHCNYVMIAVIVYKVAKHINIAPRILIEPLNKWLNTNFPSSYTAWKPYLIQSIHNRKSLNKCVRTMIYLNSYTEATLSLKIHRKPTYISIVLRENGFNSVFSLIEKISPFLHLTKREGVTMIQRSGIKHSRFRHSYNTDSQFKLSKSYVTLMAVNKGVPLNQIKYKISYDKGLRYRLAHLTKFNIIKLKLNMPYLTKLDDIKRGNEQPIHEVVDALGKQVHDITSYYDYILGILTISHTDFTAVSLRLGCVQSFLSHWFHNKLANKVAYVTFNQRMKLAVFMNHIAKAIPVSPEKLIKPLNTWMGTDFPYEQWKPYLIKQIHNRKSLYQVLYAFTVLYGYNPEYFCKQVHISRTLSDIVKRGGCSSIKRFLAKIAPFFNFSNKDCQVIIQHAYINPDN